MKTDELIERLVADAVPVRPLPSPALRASLWASAALVIVTLGILYFGVRRDVAAAWHNPAFLVRLILLGATVWLAIASAFRLAVPGGDQRALSRWWPIVVLGALVALAAGEVAAAAVAGDVGSPFGSWACVRKVCLVGILPAVFALVLIQRAAPVEPRWTALLGVLAGGAAGAIASELACPVRAPLHILLWHILPVGVFACLGVALGALLWRRPR